MSTNANNTDGLATLTPPNGSVPETRMKSAMDAQSIFQSLFLADQQYRSPKRAKVKGLVDGNPPYRQSDLRAAGRSNDCNVNWRIAESYLNAALGAFYDIFSESETYATILLDQPNSGDRDEKSRIATEEFDRLQRREDGFDYNMQISQYEMVLYGFGPFIFQDAHNWKATAGRCGDFYVPSEAKSDTSLWEMGMMRIEYAPDKLYEFIRDEETARLAGWNVKQVKNSIMEACPRTESQTMNWEWYQQRLKDGAFTFSYMDGSKKIFAVHVWFKEFPKDGEVEGRISHKVFLESYNLQNDDKFLFEKIGRFENWNECVHAMYYDHGGGGDHHSVTGMGVKMFAAMEYQNRLLCKLADDAFAPKMLFKPTSASQSQKMNLAVFGNYAVMPNGFDLNQQAINPLLQDSMAFNREVSGLVASNLSQYRQDLQKEDGNPVTATEAQWRASEQSRLGKTQLNRYYDQLDKLYAEKYRRACNPNLTKQMPGGKEALEFQERCKKRGVSSTDLNRVDSVKATRIVGQGSAFMRQQSLEFLLGMVAMMPEGGRELLIKDVIAARAGQTSVSRYFPTKTQDVKAQNQRSDAQDKIVGMKVGVPPIVIETQNPIVYATEYLAAAAQAAGSLQGQNGQQGANPAVVFSFLEIAGPAIAAQLQRIANDPTRKTAYDALLDQWKKLAKIHDDLGRKIQQNMAQQQQQAQQNGALQQDAAKAQLDMQLKAAKAAQALEQKAAKHNQNMALQDASAAAAIRRQ